ncbi:MAG: gamma carbonic anhydrase family protein [Thiotrichaceae bacterium]|nr:gamma carbonic anhydrase family protein [Thiotrichaceae bacterium]
MNIRSYNDHPPSIHPSVFIDESAVIIGQVTIGKYSSVWPLTAIRGDVQSITIGEYTNIQDGSVLHVTHGSEYSFTPEGNCLHIGDKVTIGHKAILHACTIHNNCLIGMGAIVLDGAIIQDNVIVGAGSLVPSNKVLDSGYLWLGSPVKKARKLTDKELIFLEYSAKHYKKLAGQHRKQQ